MLRRFKMARRVLIVDDSAFMRTMVRGALANAGYDIVAEADNGEVAIQQYVQLKPDLVTMDLVMVGNGGMDALKRIVAHDPKARVLVVSAMGQQALVIEAIQTGAKGFLVKPFEPEQLMEEAKRILG